MNVLLDRHHAGLYRSMQLLAARLGWTLYTPVGLDWQAEGYWNFGMNVPGLTEDLAKQYLVPHDGVWRHGQAGGIFEDWYQTEDPEFPAAPIFGVTLENAKLVARTGFWDIVIASLDDNQWGFSRFAREVGAEFVVQVGNTGQHVAWELDPLAIVSSEVPIRGRAVRYHQEMDPAASRFVDPMGAGNLDIVSSFVNCFPRIGSCYDLWLEAQRSIGEFRFREYGIDGLDGVVKPISTLAAAMGASTFGWHDKVHGDGFGHVIHGWAAVGRPLIGHASHYFGKMAANLWQHGVTAIDLDQVSVPEAVAMMRDIADDPDRHAAMCHAIRAEYDRIDHDAEAAAIADLLGVSVPA